jgi:hypothetical protein
MYYHSSSDASVSFFVPAAMSSSCVSANITLPDSLALQ